MNINFFILAGGYGLRANPLSKIRPKPIFPLNGKPLINILLKQLEKKNFRSGYINLHYLSEKLKSKINSKLKINYIHEEILSGSAVLNKIKDCNEEYTLIVNGDIFLEIPIEELLMNIRETNADGVLLVREDTANSYNKLTAKKVKFTGITNKELQGKMYTGIAIFKTKIFKNFKDESFFTSLKENKFDIRVLEYNKLWLDLGTPKQYFDSVFKYHKYSGLKDSNSTSDTAYISEDSRVENSILWDRVNINGNSNIINSIILDDVNINNLNISNKIAFIQDEKLTLFDL